MILDRPLRVRLDNRIAKAGRWKVWQWTVFVDSWPVAVGSTDARQCWFAMCALEDYVTYR